MYPPFTNSLPPNRVETEHHFNGMVRRNTHYENDKKHGLYNEWYRNGSAEYEVNFKNGKKHGKATWWYENGLKRLETTWSVAKVYGLMIGWHESGKKQTEKQYINDEVYSQIEWDEEGNIIAANFPTPPPLPEPNPLNRLKKLALSYSRVLIPSQYR